ncbi:MAG TPA: hypothetical protein PKJ33_01810 [Alphaproteobacteria bacterium]|nr:hypothetical protein [Alphaproteobacteria bacterium]
MKKSDVLSVIAIIISIIALGMVLFACPKGPRPMGPNDMRGGDEMMQGQPAARPGEQMRGEQPGMKGPQAPKQEQPKVK